jgi:glycosyltransferase involved in cell wall biosynthesis
VKKVLIITYYWPPGSGPGVQRFLKFSKYLREFGWEPIILTVENGSYPSVDASLEKEVPPNLKVVKTKTFEPFQWYNLLKGKKGKSTGVGMVGLQNPSLFQKLALHIRANCFVPDARKGWKKYALKSAQEIVQTDGVDAIITTGPPHSAHLIGLELKKETELPWVADMRDPWTTIFYNSDFPRTESTKRKDKSLEDLVLRTADAITVVSKGLEQEFSDRNSAISVIYNGYDEDDIPLSIPKRNERFTISYVGNFMPNQNPNVLWELLAELKEEVVGFSKDLQLFFTGNVDDSIVKSVCEKGLGKQLKIAPFIPHKEAVKRMSAADVLLFVIPESKGNKLIITGKLFEYLATGNPILSIGPVSGDAAELLKDAQRTPMNSFTDKAAVKSQLLSFYQNWKEGKSEKVESSQLAKFTRRELTRKLADKLNELTEN